MPETIYLVMHDGYSSECQVGFTNKDKADAHADKVGGFVQPIVRMNRAPKNRLRIMRVTTIDSRGIIKRSDLHEIIEWEYEQSFQHPEKTTSSVSKYPFHPYDTQVFTSGYDHLDVEREHRALVKENGGIEL